MNIAVTAEAPGLDAAVDRHFACCAYLVFANTASGDYQVMPNPGASLEEGRCSALTAFLAGNKVECVLSGKCGTHARQKLAAAGIRIIEGCEGTVRDAIQRFAPHSAPNPARP